MDTMSRRDFIQRSAGWSLRRSGRRSWPSPPGHGSDDELRVAVLGITAAGRRTSAPS